MPTCSSVLPHWGPRTQLRGENWWIQEWKNTLLFLSLNTDRVLVDRISDNYGQPLLRIPTGCFFSANLRVQQERVFTYPGTTKKKHCMENAYCWWGWFLVITCTRNRPWTSKGHTQSIFCININLKIFEQRECKSLSLAQHSKSLINGSGRDQ